jgi:hypothetical protein
LLRHFKATLITYEEGKEKVRVFWYGGIPVKLSDNLNNLVSVYITNSVDQRPTSNNEVW